MKVQTYLVKMIAVGMLAAFGTLQAPAQDSLEHARDLLKRGQARGAEQTLNAIKSARREHRRDGQTRSI